MTQITMPVKKTNITHTMWALFVLFCCLSGVALLYSYHREAFWPTLFGFGFGYILQRSRFCFAAGFRDIFIIRNTSLTRAILLALLLTTLGFALIHFFSEHSPKEGGLVYPLGLHTAVGGTLFGFGMVIAGNCVSGCLMRMGEGYLMQWFTFAGLLISSGAGAWHLSWWDRVFIRDAPSVFLPDHLGWGFSLALQSGTLILLYIIAAGYEKGWRTGFFFKPDRWRRSAEVSKSSLFSDRSWPYAAGAVGLALGNTLLFFLWGRPWSITSGLTNLAGWLGTSAGLSPLKWLYFQETFYLEHCEKFLCHPLLYLVAAMIAGSLTASLQHNEFRIRRPRSGKYILSALAGGALMGYGSRVALGCNIGALLSGISSLSLHGWVFGAAILVGAYLGGKFFIRYLL